MDGRVIATSLGLAGHGRQRSPRSRPFWKDDHELLADLTGVEYGYALREGRDAIVLEKKEDMKKRGLASPDLADALALTFAYPVAATDHRWQLTGKPRHQHEYNPFQHRHHRYLGRRSTSLPPRITNCLLHLRRDRPRELFRIGEWSPQEPVPFRKRWFGERSPEGTKSCPRHHPARERPPAA